MDFQPSVCTCCKERIKLSGKYTGTNEYRRLQYLPGDTEQKNVYCKPCRDHIMELFQIPPTRPELSEPAKRALMLQIASIVGPLMTLDANVPRDQYEEFLLTEGRIAMRVAQQLMKEFS